MILKMRKLWWLVVMLPSVTLAQVDGRFANLTALSVNNVQNASLFAGADIGAQINAAVAALPTSGGVVFVPGASTCYSFTTPIVINNKPVVLEGTGPATCLTYTPTSGTAISFNGIGSPITYVGESAGNGMRDITLQGSSAGAAASTVGIYLNGVAKWVSYNVQVMQFHIGETYGSNTFIINHYGANFRANYQAIYAPNQSISNSYENVSFTNSEFGNGTQTDSTSTGQNCIQLGTAVAGESMEFNFIDSSFDNCQVVLGDNRMRTTFLNPHFEDPATTGTLDYPFVKMTTDNSQPSQADIVNPVFFVDSPTVTADSFVELNGDSDLNLSNARMFGYGGTSTPPVWVTIKGAGNAILNTSGVFVGDIGGEPNPTYAAPIYSTDGVNAPFVNTQIASVTQSVPIAADGQVVLAQGRNTLSGDFWITWRNTGRTHLIKAHVGVDAYAASGQVSTPINWTNSPVITNLQVVLSSGIPQLVATIGNRNGTTGPLVVQWTGDGNNVPSILPGTAVGSTPIPTYGTTVAQDYYWTVPSACTLGTGQPASCTGSTTLPAAMIDANYQISCSTQLASVTSGTPFTGCSITNVGALPYAAGATINFAVVQTMQNSTTGAVANVFLHAHHN